MGFFNKLASIINGKEVEKKPEVKQKSVDNSISMQEELTNSIMKVMKNNFKGQSFSLNDKILRIWILDNIKYESLQESDYAASLFTHLDAQMGLVFSKIELNQGPLPDNHGFASLGNSVYLEICQKTLPNRARKAELFAIPNYGSLKMEKYVLDSVEIEGMASRRYNIGAGEYPDVRGRFRHNHIAIDDDPDSAGYERNKYVSRTHAYIRYSVKDGFLLQAEPEGTPKADKGTRIYRDEVTIDVDDVVAQPLKDGDCIELSKNVRLMFKVLV